MQQNREPTNTPYNISQLTYQAKGVKKTSIEQQSQSFRHQFLGRLFSWMGGGR